MRRSLRILYVRTVLVLTYIGNRVARSFMHECICLMKIRFCKHEKARTWRALVTLGCQSVMGEYLPLTESL